MTPKGGCNKEVRANANEHTWWRVGVSSSRRSGVRRQTGHSLLFQFSGLSVDYCQHQKIDFA